MLKNNMKIQHTNDKKKIVFSLLLLIFSVKKWETSEGRRKNTACHPELHSSLQASRSHKQHTSLLNPCEGLQIHSKPSHSNTGTKVWDLPWAGNSADTTFPASAPVSSQYFKMKKQAGQLKSSCHRGTN